eukprot:5121635-Heterocapsa_arctica.AAC.1
MSTRRSTSRTWRSIPVDPLAAINSILTHLKRLIKDLFEHVAVQSRRTTGLEDRLTSIEERLTVLEKWLGFDIEDK